MSAYLDASVLLPVLIEEAYAAFDAYLLDNEQELLIGDFIVAEVALALSRLVRAGRLDANDVEQPG